MEIKHVIIVFTVAGLFALFGSIMKAQDNMRRKRHYHQFKKTQNEKAALLDRPA
ncbi:hypothetical protein [Mucilaginibacter limnophilus]|uniref:hypothetical protein n=1 Tax=Mucilaginibacter limnophilus TaxID=1932778 RepID=UPI0013E36197|nr:hypothetical protein [Mucilaginibacter limnophilus]